MINAENDLKNLLDEKKNDKDLSSLDEISIKNHLILPILNALGWNVFNINEVSPEYSVGSKRVDYSLRVVDKEVFLEVKKPAENIDKHQEQLLQYAFQQGVELAILCNGIDWWFYLPTKKGNWKSRKFHALNLFEQDITDVTSKMINLLSKEKIRTGDAVRFANSLHEGKLRSGKLDEFLPKAWNEIIEKQEPILTQLLADTTEKLCGYRPKESELKDFFRENVENFMLNRPFAKDEKQNAAFVKKGSQPIGVTNLSPVRKTPGFEIMKMGMRLLKETNGDISDRDAVNELLKTFPDKTPESLKAEMGKLRQNYNHIVGNTKSKAGVVSKIIDQLKAGEKATAGVSDTTNKYSTRAWQAFHEV